MRKSMTLLFMIDVIWDKPSSRVPFSGQSSFCLISYTLFFIFSLLWYIHILISYSIIVMTLFVSFIVFDPLYDEIVTNTSDLMVYIIRHFFIELVLPLFIFIAVMLAVFLNWSWIPISWIERERGLSLGEVKKQLFE